MKAVFHEWYFVCTHFDIYYVLNLWITCCVICQSQKGFFFFFFSVAENAFHVFTNNAVNHMHSRSVLFVPRSQSYRHFTFSSPRRLNLINHSNFQRADYIFFLYIQPTTVSSLFHSFISIVVEDRRFSNNRYEVNKNCKIEF